MLSIIGFLKTHHDVSRITTSSQNDDRDRITVTFHYRKPGFRTTTEGRKYVDTKRVSLTTRQYYKLMEWATTKEAKRYFNMTTGRTYSEPGDAFLEALYSGYYEDVIWRKARKGLAGMLDTAILGTWVTL